MNGRKIDIRCSNDRAQGGSRKTLVRKHLFGDIQNALFGIGHAHTSDSIIRLNECQAKRRTRNAENGETETEFVLNLKFRIRSPSLHSPRADFFSRLTSQISE